MAANTVIHGFAPTVAADVNRQSDMIDIGGRRLAFACAGEGTPVVILETGLGAESAEWAAVQDEVSKVTRVLRYDRAGRGQAMLRLGRARPSTCSAICGNSFGGLDSEVLSSWWGNLSVVS